MSDSDEEKEKVESSWDIIGRYKKIERIVMNEIEKNEEERIVKVIIEKKKKIVGDKDEGKIMRDKEKFLKIRKRNEVLKGKEERR